MKTITAIIIFSSIYLSCLSQTRELTFYSSSIGIELRDQYKKDSIIIELTVRNFDKVPIAIPDSSWNIGNGRLAEDSTRQFVIVSPVAIGNEENSIRVRKLDPGKKYIYSLKVPKLYRFLEIYFYYSNQPNYLNILSQQTSKVLSESGFTSASEVITIRDFVP